jgi:hypothetical protein
MKTCGEVSQISVEWCCSSVGAMSEALLEMKPREGFPDIEAAFRTQCGGLARVIASVIRKAAYNRTKEPSDAPARRVHRHTFHHCRRH